MNPIPELAPFLKQLRLSGILDSLEARNLQAIDSKLAYTEFLALLIQDEVARREQKKFSLRLRRAAFRATKTLEQFDFERLPQLNRALVHDLATGRYLAEKTPVLIVGPCGTGKSHLAQALGHCAVRQGVDVVFTTCASLVANLNAARASMLTRLKLTAIRDQLDSLPDSAARRKLSLVDTVKMLCEAEVARKDERRIQMASSIAKFPFVRTLEQFEFDAQPSLDPKLVQELATARWVANGDALLLLGPPGVGKTHLAVALGREVIHRGYTTIFTSATALVTALTKAHHDGRLEERLAHFAKPKLLIVDELGYLPLETNAAHLFFQLVSRRYERGAMLVTSNRAVSEWGTAFGDSVVATAILDRLLHHSHVITIRGDSYRLREKRRSGLLQNRPADKVLEKLT